MCVCKLAIYNVLRLLILNLHKISKFVIFHIATFKALSNHPLVSVPSAFPPSYWIPLQDIFAHECHIPWTRHSLFNLMSCIAICVNL